MTFSYDETKFVIDKVLDLPIESAEKGLKIVLEEFNRATPEFYEGVIKHGPKMPYTSDQWLDFLRKIPHWRLRDEKTLMDKLSPRQRSLLPPI